MEHSPYVDPELYDVVYSWYTPDIAFYVDAAKRARGPVLEVGCGTGRVLLPTLEAGVDIDGLDLEPGMLAVLESKAQARGRRVRVVVGDMRDFTMPRKYALITLPFRAFMHMLDTEDQLQALRCMREHLERGGELLLNLFYPSARYLRDKHEQRLLEREFPHPETGSTVGLYDTARYDVVGQTVTVEREVVESDPSGHAGATHRYGFTLRWTYRFEMELLLRTAGFSRWQVAGGFDSRPLESDTDEMVWAAWKD